jgi:hypothetical protein
MIENIPLLNSPKTSVKVLGAIIYAFIGLILLGALTGPQTDEDKALDELGFVYDNSSFGQTGKVQYATPEGTFAFNLPDGFYLIYKMISSMKDYGFDDNVYSIRAVRTMPDCTYDDSYGNEHKCPGYGIRASWGIYPEGQTFESRVEGAKQHLKSDGNYTKTASGQTAWWEWFPAEKNQGWYMANVDYSEDPNKFMEIRVDPINEDSPSELRMTSKEFKNFIESIEIQP